MIPVGNDHRHDLPQIGVVIVSLSHRIGGSVTKTEIAAEGNAPDGRIPAQHSPCRSVVFPDAAVLGQKLSRSQCKSGATRRDLTIGGGGAVGGPDQGEDCLVVNMELAD